MVLVQNLKFCEGVVLCKIHPEKVFGDVLVRKQAFLGNINTDLKRRQNWHFCDKDSMYRSMASINACVGVFLIDLFLTQYIV